MTMRSIFFGKQKTLVHSKSIFSYSFEDRKINFFTETPYEISKAFESCDFSIFEKRGCFVTLDPKIAMFKFFFLNRPDRLPLMALNSRFVRTNAQSITTSKSP